MSNWFRVGKILKFRGPKNSLKVLGLLDYIRIYRYVYLTKVKQKLTSAIFILILIGQLAKRENIWSNKKVVHTRI